MERYQFFNRYEGNSNTGLPDGYAIAATTIPNTEDINEDLTLGTIESYYQYEIPMTPADLTPENIGKGYLADILRRVPPTFQMNSPQACQVVPIPHSRAGVSKGGEWHQRFPFHSVHADVHDGLE